MSRTEADRLSRDEVYNLLSNPRRRFIISYLREHGEVNLQELASTVAAWENETTVDDLSSQQKKRVYVSLYQTHIPKLQETGIVTYDRDSGRIAIRDTIDQLDRYIPTEGGSVVDWRRVYLALALGGGLAYGLVWLDVSVFALVPEATMGALIIAGFAAVVVVHYLVERTGSLAPQDGTRGGRSD